MQTANSPILNGSDAKKADAAFRAQRRLRHPRTKQAAELIDRNDLNAAEAILSAHLAKNPRDSAGLNLLAEIAINKGDPEKAAPLFAKSLDISPGFALARFNHAQALFKLNRLTDALAELDRLLGADPHNCSALDLKAVVLAVMGQHEDSMRCRRALVDCYPADADLLMKYGSALGSLGARVDAVSAYREAIVLRPAVGAAWWELAQLKAYDFSSAELATMRAQLARNDLSRQDRIYLHFALGRALGDRRDYEGSFENFARANALKRATVKFDPDDLTRHVARCKSVFTPEFLASRRDVGCAASDPIFIIGMQRAGSTLVEQILASHSAVEATAELPDISFLAHRIGTAVTPDDGYPEGLAQVASARFEEFGQQYLDTASFRRVLGRLRFVDKMPYNFLHLGLIHLMLPQAKIVDVRRHPMACCFSNFSMHFEAGPLFSHRLNELGRAYSDYVAQLAHFDAVLPGRILRVFYEDIVSDPEGEIRRLFDYLELPFEEGCLRFHESGRAMSSVSAEQVRRPISTEAIDYWKNYEPWLGPLKAALGPVLDAYPAVPEFVS